MSTNNGPFLVFSTIAWVRLTVQELLDGGPVLDGSSPASQHAGEKLPVTVIERWAAARLLDDLERRGDSIRVVRRADVDPLHAFVQPLECSGVVARRDTLRNLRLVGPQRDHEAVHLVHERLHPRLERSHRAVGLGEPLREVDLELGGSVPRMGNPGKDITGQEAHGEAVRVVHDDRVVDRQAER